ncbi:pollen-specific leucine-rich repeat extensin-like protein 4 [Iris pallida]|uniref:Pollen-specific leucine-rich repeat extensin-like protein 4 n=1 Tax=Iris pallida TaxID=29817 RepID=A0AAX6FGS8_IRIPA|nr:pollen-specific leucine-rich repeat extensin-like protein 4 [Iris pallida]KAJ6845371.1 pollen-specific leucine-rich repeat extensin-like protein 4 [Iris pallida]
MTTTAVVSALRGAMTTATSDPTRSYQRKVMVGPRRPIWVVVATWQRVD